MMNGGSELNSSPAGGIGPLAAEMRRKTMTAKKIIVATAILLGGLGASSAALAQSAWTTGTAENRAEAGYASPYGGGLYAYAPGFVSRHSSGLSAFAMVPRTGGSRYSATANGGGSRGYNWAVENDR
jgi:hypothetical protein